MDNYTYSFEKLEVWKLSIELVKEVYKVTREFPEDEKYGLVSQLRRCSTSVSSNIAEGAARKSTKEKAHFYTIAYGSLMEAINQIIISFQLEYLDETCYLDLREKAGRVSRMLNALRKSQDV